LEEGGLRQVGDGLVGEVVAGRAQADDRVAPDYSTHSVFVLERNRLVTLVAPVVFDTADPLVPMPDWLAGQEILDELLDLLTQGIAVHEDSEAVGVVLFGTGGADWLTVVRHDRVLLNGVDVHGADGLGVDDETAVLWELLAAAGARFCLPHLTASDFALAVVDTIMAVGRTATVTIVDAGLNETVVGGRHDFSLFF